MPNAGELWRKFQDERETGISVPRARRQFVGREDARQAYYALLAQALEQDFRGCYIIHYHGIGGIGKSTLLRQLRQELTVEETAVPEKVEQARAHVRELLQKKDRKQGAVVLQADFDDTSITTVQDVLTRFRAQIMEQRNGAMFPLFDLALLRLSRKHGRRVPPDEEKAALSDNPVVAFALDVVGDLTGAGLLIGAGQMVAGVAQSMRRMLADRKGCIRRANTEINQMSAPELIQSLPYYFAMDVNAMELPLLCVYLDTYEKMISHAEGAGRSTGFDEQWLWGRQGLVKNLGNAVFAIAGREALDTQNAEKNELFRADPNRQPDGSIRLIGDLGREDSALFLSGCGITDQNLRGELYELTHGNPFYLDLCVDEYEHLMAGGRRTLTRKDFGRTNERLAERYLRYVRPGLQDAVCMLCAMGRWTDGIYRQLARYLPQLPMEGETGYNELIHLTYVERTAQGWRIQRTVAEVLAQELSPTLYRSLADALAKTAETEIRALQETNRWDSLDILVNIEAAPITPETAAAMEARAENYTKLCLLNRARLWQERAFEQWKYLEDSARRLRAAGRLADILDSMALCSERDQVLAEGVDFAAGLGGSAPVEEYTALLERQAGYSGTWEEEVPARTEVLKLRKGLAPSPSDRAVWMAQCRLGWALYNCDEPDPRTGDLLKEAFERLKEADAAENRIFSPQTLFAAEILCQFAENILGKPAYGAGRKALLENTRKWMRGLPCALTGAEPLEELRLWQEWLDLNEEMRADIHCGLSLDGMFDLQRKVMEGLSKYLGEHSREVMTAAHKTVKGYLRAHEDMSGKEEFLIAILNADQCPLGSQKKPVLTLFEDPDFVIGCCRDLVELRTLYLGREHPDTFEAMDLLARICDGAGRYEEAVQIRREALELYERLSERQKERDRLTTSLITDYERLEWWEQAVWAQENYLSHITTLDGSAESGQRRLLELYLEWLWQDQALTEPQTQKILRAVRSRSAEIKDKRYRDRCMESARQWCLEHEHLADAELWDDAEAAWKENDGRDK